LAEINEMGSERNAGARSQAVVCLGVEPTGDAYSRGVGAFDLERFIFENQDSDDGVPTTHAPRPSLPPPTQLGGLPQPRAPRPQTPPQLGSAPIGSAPRPQLADEGVPDLEEVLELKENSNSDSDAEEPITSTQVDSLLGLLDFHRSNFRRRNFRCHPVAKSSAGFDSNIKADDRKPDHVGLMLDPRVSLNAKVAEKLGQLLAKTLRYI